MKKLKIGTKLTLSVCGLLLVACGGIALLSYYSSSETLQQAIEETLPALTTDAAKIVRLRLDNYLLGIEGVANRSVIRSMDFA
ncbi:MAG: hypothetical protein PHP44_06040 [Kiritimatiellae bacterium]|nr:hypothetical protein [Kiritimatiellia bacterium]